MSLIAYNPFLREPLVSLAQPFRGFAPALHEEQESFYHRVIYGFNAARMLHNAPHCNSDSEQHDLLCICVLATRPQVEAFLRAPAVATSCQYVRAIVTTPEYVLLLSSHHQDIVYVSQEPRKVYALLARMLHPQAPRYLGAVTGTNGKSSVVSFARQLCGLLDPSHGFLSVGTLGFEQQCHHAVQHTANNMTTPDAYDLSRALHANALCDGAFLEVTSHALDQDRIYAYRFDSLVWTNLSQDHLDYHLNIENYFLAKRRALSLLKSHAPLIVYRNTLYFDALRAHYNRLWTYGTEESDVYACIATKTPAQASQKDAPIFEYVIKAFGEHYSAACSLIGDIQIQNLLAASCMVHHMGYSLKSIFAQWPHIVALCGRLEPVASHVYVDYAHTPDALLHAIAAIRALPGIKRLWLVFGCGGNRDQTKRPYMGRVAQQADCVIITDDNPRQEDPEQIRKTLKEVCPKAICIACRATAIHTALDRMAPSDALLIAGKGHEKTQTYGDRVVPLCDQDIVKQWLSDKSSQ